MRALLVTYDFPPIISGISTYLYQLCRPFTEAGFVVLAPKVEGAREFDRSSSLATVRYPHPADEPLLRFAILLPCVLLWCLRKKIDTLVCAVPVSLGAIGLVCKRLLGIRYCVCYYGGEWEKYKRNILLFPLLRAVLAQAHYVIADSAFSAAEAAHYGIAGERIVTITPAVDSGVFRPDIDCADLRRSLQLEGKKVLLTVARLVKRKGIDVVIQALPAIKQSVPGITFVVVGNGPERQQLCALAVRLGVQDEVVFTGYVPDAALPCYYNLCDLYVMPTRTTVGEDETLEGFGISFLEAAACGKSAVGGLSGGVQEAVLDKTTGILADPDQPGVIARAITDLLRDDTARKTLGDNARRRVERAFSWGERSARLKELLQC